VIVCSEELVEEICLERARLKISEVSGTRNHDIILIMKIENPIDSIRDFTKENASISLDKQSLLRS